MHASPSLADSARSIRPAQGPYVGALLRLSWRRVRDGLHAAIREAGFTDLQEAHLPVFSYPLPDGVRPSDLARRLGVSRQAVNHLVAQMESLGYLERRAGEVGERRLIHLTERGWAVGEVVFACLRELEAAWAADVGEDRFRDFMGVLRRFAGVEEDADAPAETGSSEAGTGVTSRQER